jgi:hypothetical protein
MAWCAFTNRNASAGSSSTPGRTRPRIFLECRAPLHAARPARATARAQHARPWSALRSHRHRRRPSLVEPTCESCARACRTPSTTRPAFGQHVRARGFGVDTQASTSASYSQSSSVQASCLLRRVSGCPRNRGNFKTSSSVRTRSSSSMRSLSVRTQHHRPCGRKHQRTRRKDFAASRLSRRRRALSSRSVRALFLCLPSVSPPGRPRRRRPCEPCGQARCPQSGRCRDDSESACPSRVTGRPRVLHLASPTLSASQARS